MNEITAFITALSHVTNIAKAAIQARDEAKRIETLTELNSALSDLHVRHLAVAEKQHALLAEKEALKKQIDAYDNWEKEKRRYRLQNIGRGTVVYSLDPAQAAGDPLHWLCAHCYEDRKKGFFHSHGKVQGHYKCDRCGTGIEPIKSPPNPA